MKFKAVTLLLSLIVISQTTEADNVYVRDTLYVPLRGGQSSEHRILHRGIRSGTALQRLEINETSGFSLVKMESGLEGWIQTQYLVDSPIAKDLLEQANESLASLQRSHQQLLLSEQQSTADQSRLTDEHEQISNQNRELTTELNRLTELSANVISIDEANKQLRQEHDGLLLEIDSLAMANRELQDSSNQQWFLRGAGVIIAGLLLGFLFSRSIYHKRSTSGWE